VPTLAALDEQGGEAKLVTLQRRLGASRELLKRTLLFLIDARLVLRNPGYGHPMRPEYLLTPAGRVLAPACARLLKRLDRLGIEEIGLKKWSLPVADALATADGRFNRIRAILSGVTPRALAQALRDLQMAGLVERRLIDDSPPRTEYRLTRAGLGIAPLVRALAGTP